MSSANLILEQFEIGPMANFSYLIGDPKTHEIAIVDPAWDAQVIINRAETFNCKIVAILLTHGHSDHVNAVEELLEARDVPVYLSAIEAKTFGLHFPQLRKTEDQETLQIGGISVKCIQTPGHTPGSHCFLCEGNLITGDTMFIDGCGRCDLPGGNPEKMYHSLYKIILSLPDETVIYPGHDYGKFSSATLKEQKQTNPYLTCESKQDFLRRRM